MFDLVKEYSQEKGNRKAGPGIGKKEPSKALATAEAQRQSDPMQQCGA